MATTEVPGFDPANADELRVGVWAEHKDGSLLVVEGTEGGQITYSMFDTSRLPIVEYRDGMPEKDFKEFFSWKSTSKKKTPVQWTWHDKHEFPWDKIIGKGARDGMRFASARDQLS